MQIKVFALTKKGEGFPSNKHINAIKKLRTRFEVVDFSRVELKKGFTAVFNAETNYVALVEEIDYVGVIKAFGDGFSNVKIVKYGNALTEFVNSLPSGNKNVETYKLFNVTIPTLESFLVNYSFKYNVKIFDGDVTLKIDFSTLSFEEKDAFLKDFLTKFNDKIYAFYDTTAEKALLDLLTVRGMKLAVAESFTGGNISALISSVSGASKVFYEGVVAYDEDAKKSRLGVQFETLIKYKPVSKQVAYEMCKGLLEND
ncbi:MAG: nicotinamide-nucleotide amidohydrolase family protein, partial [Clostridia bacterium]|nr:nicotinamide-nucleotide amidohydrolase family protein [Clostridia bacterium]